MGREKKMLQDAFPSKLPQPNDQRNEDTKCEMIKKREKKPFSKRKEKEKKKRPVDIKKKKKKAGPGITPLLGCRVRDNAVRLRRALNAVI
ncbi:hypothetical protein LX36DRAFT_106486 [Colletotrichum falcatum]|nr:hypothetical protein LX36DRAFT_106486 [Colletotrichum falcatum]